MAIVKFSADLHSHPSARLAGNASLGLWARLACWTAANRGSNGVAPTQLARSYGTATQISRMVRSGLASEVENGYQLNGELFTVIAGGSRPYIPAWIRQSVFDRDGWACVECSATDDLTLDHIFPWSLGGPDTVDNLRVLCRPCNSRKGAKV